MSIRKATLIAICILTYTFIVCCTPKKDADTKFQQYFVQGEKLYLQHCSNCHQKNGSGLGRVYPPLNKSDFMENNFEEVLCLMRYGKKGELVVNGISYNQTMPGVPLLSDLEIAEIATYMYNSWSHKKGIVDVTNVIPITTKCDH